MLFLLRIKEVEKIKIRRRLINQRRSNQILLLLLLVLLSLLPLLKQRNEDKVVEGKKTNGDEE